MRRRDFVKAVLAASLSPKALTAQQSAPASVAPAVPPPMPPKGPSLPAPGPVPWMRGLNEVKPLHMTPLVPDAVANTNSHYFSERQYATLHHLCEVLLPPLDTFPGAIDAGAPEFLDFLISASPEERQKMYKSGLDRLDSDAKHRFNSPFAELSEAQAGELIQPWLRTWMTDHPPTDPHERFINLAHSDIRTATINSQRWSDALRAQGDDHAEVGLYWFPVDPDLRGNESHHG